MVRTIAQTGASPTSRASRAQGRLIDCPVFVGWSLSANADVVPVFVDIAINDCPYNTSFPVNRLLKSRQYRVVIGPGSAALLRACR
jgi:hypothetical protein